MNLCTRLILINLETWYRNSIKQTEKYKKVESLLIKLFCYLDSSIRDIQFTQRRVTYLIWWIFLRIFSHRSGFNWIQGFHSHNSFQNMFHLRIRVLQLPPVSYQVLTILAMLVGLYFIIQGFIGQFIEIILAPDFLLLNFLNFCFHLSNTIQLFIPVFGNHLIRLFPLVAFDIGQFQLVLVLRNLNINK